MIISKRSARNVSNFCLNNPAYELNGVFSENESLKTFITILLSYLPAVPLQFGVDPGGLLIAYGTPPLFITAQAAQLHNRKFKKTNGDIIFLSYVKI